MRDVGHDKPVAGSRPAPSLHNIRSGGLRGDRGLDPHILYSGILRNTGGDAISSELGRIASAGRSVFLASGMFEDTQGDCRGDERNLEDSWSTTR